MQIFKNKLAQAIAGTAPAKHVGLGPDNIAGLFTKPPKPEMGDLALPAFPFAKVLGVKPPEAATQLEEALEADMPDYVSELRVTGPYLNAFIKPEALAQSILKEVAQRSCSDAPEDWHFGENESGNGRTMAIDISSPNIAKPLGVHHLRSTMIGNSIKKIYEACGWRVVGVNHLGDWGTGFGKIIHGFCETYPDEAKLIADKNTPDAEIDSFFNTLSASDINRIYVDFSKRAAEDPLLEDAGKREFKELEASLESDLEANDPDTHQMRRNFRLWQQIKQVSLREFEVVYRLLGVKFAPWPIVIPELKAIYDEDPQKFLREYSVYTGESYFLAGAPHCKTVIDDSKAKGLAVESDGALVIFVDGEDQPPVMLLKDDGATSYHTRDMAAARYRRDHFTMDKGIYCVGGEQKLHFRQLFKVLEMLGHDWAKECEHVDFGLMLSKDKESGKWGKFSTRKGKVVLLHDLLEDAINEVKKVIASKNPELSNDEGRFREIATAVGVGAVVFNDLKHGRRSDVKFDWDEVLSFSGETGPYMLYQYVRLGSVKRKFFERYGEIEGEPDYTKLAHPQERELLKSIAAFPEVVQRACDDNEPSVISRYLLDISALFSSYWTATKDEGIVGDDQSLSRARIELVSSLRKVLGKGLLLLGLRLVEEM